MSGKKQRGEKSVLTRQEIANRKRNPSEKKPQLAPKGNGRRAIAGVFLAAGGLFALVALASFEPRGLAPALPGSLPGAAMRGASHVPNAAGPVGHVLADVLAGALGIGAYALPLMALYGAGVLWVGRRDRRRWPQLVGGVVLFFSFLVVVHLAMPAYGPHARPPAGTWGAGLGEALRAWFSTAGTFIVVTAVALAAVIVATERAALRAAAAFGRLMKQGGERLGVALAAAGVSVKEMVVARREAAAQAKLEEAAFLAQLEADQEEASQAEQDADEAEAVAEEAFRLAKEAEAQREAARAKGETEPPLLSPAPSRRRERRTPMAALPADGPETLAAPVEKVAAEQPVTQKTAKDERATEPAAAAVVALAKPEPAGTAPLARTPVIVEPKAPPKPSRTEKDFEFVGDRTSFTLPPLDVLTTEKKERTQLDKEAFLTTAERLRAKLADFGITGEVVEIRPGPVVTMYEFLPGPGIKISKIASLADDLAMAMEAMRVRIVAPIPGKGVVGIEVPNRDRETVFLREIAEQDAFAKSTSKLTMCLGKDIEGMPYVFDLAKAPHLLIAGTTGSGKSVAVNAMIMSLLLKATPEEVRFIMVDPKMLELSVYEGIPHLLLPVVTDPKKAALALRWTVEEMERRYHLLSEAGVRNITGYNKLVDSVHGDAKALLALKKGAPKPSLVVDVAGDETEEAALARRRASEALPGVPAPLLQDDGDVRAPLEGDSPATLAAAAEPVQGELGEQTPSKELKRLPYIVVIIDELADLMMVASREVEMYIARLAQMARAAGIHLMTATQRPSTDVVTGVIKANFPTRISFMLRSKPDSMTILGTVGAEALLGMGDMLIMPPTSAHLQRVHGAYVSEAEIKKAVDHLKAQGKPVYDDSILKAREEDAGGEGVEDELSDDLYDQALATVSEMRQVSISMLQRKMRIGYNRAARMIERMERDGVVGPADGAKPREVRLRPVGEMPGAGAV